MLHKALLATKLLSTFSINLDDKFFVSASKYNSLEMLHSYICKTLWMLWELYFRWWKKSLPIQHRMSPNSICLHRSSAALADLLQDLEVISDITI